MYSMQGSLYSCGVKTVETKFPCRRPPTNDDRYSTIAPCSSIHVTDIPDMFVTKTNALGCFFHISNPKHLYAARVKIVWWFL